MSGQHYVTAALPPGTNAGVHLIGGWVGLGTVEYVIRNAFTQKWPRERASMLLYTYIACLNNNY
jgi:hypothetical protein